MNGTVHAKKKRGSSEAESAKTRHREILEDVRRLVDQYNRILTVPFVYASYLEWGS